MPTSRACACSRTARPVSPLNVTGPQVAVRHLAEEIGRRLERSHTSRAGNPTLRGYRHPPRAVLFGLPRVTLGKMIDWVADWVARDMPSLGKETHFSTRDGKY